MKMGRPKIASREIVEQLLEAASKKVDVHKFSRHFLMTEWEQVVDAWQLNTWEDYRDVIRLGRKTRLPEKLRSILWSIFEMVHSELKDQDRRIGVTNILVHHTGKSGDQRGTSSHLDQIDIYLHLDKVNRESGTAFKVNFNKGRSLRSDEKEPFILELVEDNEGKVKLEYKAISEDNTEKVAFYKSNGLTQKEIADKLGINQSTVSRSLKKAKGIGLITSEDKLTPKGKKATEGLEYNE